MCKKLKKGAEWCNVIICAVISGLKIFMDVLLIKKIVTV